jgi:aryl-alcohol dehydrogenase-like predicted oxidoreductase
MRFLDTNILLRYFTKDDEAKAHKALVLLQRIERGEERVETSLSVIFETVFTLDNFYYEAIRPVATQAPGCYHEGKWWPPLGGRKMGLRKRWLGRTGLMVSEVGLGAMDTPQSPEGEETLRRALDLEINFIDTAREYQGSEYLIGQVVRAREARGLCVATKTFSRNRDGAQRDVDRSLGFLGVDRVTLYQLHDVSTLEHWEQVMRKEGALEGLQIARIRGLIDYIGISSHNLEVLERAITCGEFDTVMLEYSAFYPDTEPLIRLAAEWDVGVIAMRPLGGSGRMSAVRTRMSSGYSGNLQPSRLLPYVLSHPHLSVAIPGARYPSRVEENVKTASEYQPLDEAQMRACETEAGQLY